MALQGRDTGAMDWAINPETGAIVAVASGSAPQGIGGPSPGVRDNPGTESYPNQPADGGTLGNAPPPGSPGGPTTETPGATPTPVTFDWHAYLADWGFPSDVVNELDRIFKTYSDPSQASAAALAYIRGTDWYSTTFAGIQAGIKNGVIGDEAGYRDYVNQLNQTYQRYFGRNVTTQEVANFLGQGQNVNQIGGHLQGQAYIAANKGEFQYDLGAFDPQGQATDTELNALGDQAGGLDNMLGPQVQKRIQLAQQRLGRIFQGQLATPALTVLNSNGALATTNSGGRTSDYGA